jgi:lipopolysaccharide heptosyltransferase I
LLDSRIGANLLLVGPNPNILVVRLSSLGDLVHTLPAVAALRRRFPEGRIDWLVETRHRDLLLDNPDVDSLIEVDTLGWRRRLASPRTWKEIGRALASIRARRYDLVLDLQGTIKSSVSAFLARSDRRVGFTASHLRERAAALLYTERVRQNGTGPHVIDRHLHLLTALDIAPSPAAERDFRLNVPESLEREAADRLRDLGLESYVVLNPGGSWVTKRWSPERFGRLASLIERECGLSSLVLWGPGEERMAREVVDHSQGASRLAPPTSLREMIPYIRRARLFVSGDTGPMHIASASRVPVVGIFGPTDPARNGPFGEGDEVVLRKVACGPCYKKRCPGYGNVCMTGIEPSEVLEAVRRKLDRR